MAEIALQKAREEDLVIHEISVKAVRPSRLHITVIYTDVRKLALSFQALALNVDNEKGGC